MLAYREHAAQTRGISRPNVIKPETAHPAFDKACHLFGIELRRAPVDPVTTQVDIDWVTDHIDGDTIAVVGSACNYGYGTVDPIEELSEVALERGVGLHVDGCLGGFILPFGQELGYDIPIFDYRIPGVTSHLGGHPQVRLRLQGHLGAHLPGQGAAQRAVLLPHRLERREVLLAGHGGVALGRADRRHLGGHGPAGPGGVPAVRPADLRDGGGHAGGGRAPTRSCGILGRPTFLFSFTSDEFDIYHVNDFMRSAAGASTASSTPTPCTWRSPAPRPARGWPRPSPPTWPTPWPTPAQQPGRRPQSGAIYGGVAGGMTEEADEFIKMVMADMMDAQSAIPADA